MTQFRQDVLAWIIALAGSAIVVGLIEDLKDNIEKAEGFFYKVMQWLF